MTRKFPGAISVVPPSGDDTGSRSARVHVLPITDSRRRPIRVSFRTLSEIPSLQELRVEMGRLGFSVDRGGTFTDVCVFRADGSTRVLKLLSEDPANYADAPTEAIRWV